MLFRGVVKCSCAFKALRNGSEALPINERIFWLLPQYFSLVGHLYYFLIEDSWEGLCFSEGISHFSTWYLCLAYCKSLLLVWQFLMVLRRRERNGWGGAEEHWIFIVASDSCWGNGHLTLHNLLIVRVHQDIAPSLAVVCVFL